MARRGSSFGTIVNRSIKAAVRESNRQAREYQRQENARRKAAAKQAILDSKISRIENACTVTTQIQSDYHDYLSLKNSFYNKSLESYFVKLVSNLDESVITEVLNYLKNGKRVDAIDYIKTESELSYNEILKIILYLENNMLEKLKDNEDCWFEDEIGQYEYLHPQELFDMDNYVDDYTAKAEVTISCIPLNIEESVTGKDPLVLQNKINKAVEKLNSKWLTELKKYHESKENIIVESIKNELNSILEYSLTNETFAFSFDELFDHTMFESKITKIKKPKLELINIQKIKDQIIEVDNKKPQIEDFKYNFLEALLVKTPLKNKIEKNKELKLQEETIKWSNRRELTVREIDKKVKEAEETNIQIKANYEKDTETYNDYLVAVDKEKDEFLASQQKHNKEIENKIIEFKNGKKEEVEEYFTRSLEISTYPLLMDKEIDISYNPNSKVLIIDYKIPSLNDIYDIDRINYVASKKDFAVCKLKEKDLNQIYNKFIYQLCLRNIYETFVLDTETNLVDAITFNGILSYIDKATGKPKTACVASLQANKNEFEEIDLANIEPKECFKRLKGVGAAELSSITPIMPIQNIDKTDKRFVEAYEVLETIDSGTNLASIQWQDFENLIREVFEKEFSQNGGEVKITQASRDGGIDAVAFDPDPIRGGKIVIQAKRYTNVVGVSAVRDLYGTLMNEGANSGILVTTSDYGADAYEFAKGKPINLLNGGELLGLMNKHGYKAYINLQEAKKILASDKDR